MHDVAETLLCTHEQLATRCAEGKLDSHCSTVCEHLRLPCPVQRMLPARAVGTSSARRAGFFWGSHWWRAGVLSVHMQQA